jgi:antitoxin component YwqK of YwqJK toxin-antitoxin module
MKKLFAIALLGLSLTASAQKIREEDGVYYDSLNKPYSGIYIERYPEGNIRIEMTLKDGIKDGIIYLFFDNNKVHEIRSYRTGNMHGTWITFNAKGKKVGEANYSNNLKNGKWYIWDDNGVLRYDMTYLDGQKSGIWIKYDEQGNLLETKKY